VKQQIDWDRLNVITTCKKLMQLLEKKEEAERVSLYTHAACRTHKEMLVSIADFLGVKI
jgi:hypothetical protein